MAGQTNGGLAKDAITHLGSCGYALPGIRGTPEEIDEQGSCLVEWAVIRGLLLPEAYTAGLTKYPGTSAEHQVYFRPTDDRVVKRTYPGTFGVTPDVKGHQTHATPLFYLRRLELMNHVFASDIRLEGVMMGKSMIIGAAADLPCVVVSQPWIHPATPASPHPSVNQIQDFMESMGFFRAPNLFYGWRRPSDFLTVTDAREDNFILSPVGVVPIDLVIIQRRFEIHYDPARS